MDILSLNFYSRCFFFFFLKDNFVYITRREGGGRDNQ